MPIKNIGSRIPRLGKIRIGIKEEGKNYPKGVDYFVCPEEVQAVYGERPKKLNILFHSDDIEEVFPQYYKRYGMGTGLVCKGDGETASAINTKSGEFEEIECLGTECSFYTSNKCKRIGNLHFMIVGVNRLGVYQLDTSSINSIVNVNGGIEYAKLMTKGRLAMIPFILEVIPQEVSPDGKKKIVHVLRLEANISKMLDALDQKPQEVLSIAPPKGIEEDLFPKPVIESNTKKKATLKPVSATGEVPGNPSDLVTDKQLSRMWAMVHDAAIPQEEFKTYYKNSYGVEHAKDLTKSQIEDIFKYLEEEIKELQASTV
jgi:hypothetical protein